jgi:hypothetical protein
MSHPHEQILRAGLAWLFDTDQPDGAIIQHHGCTSPEVDNRWYRFCPVGHAAATVVIVEVAHYKWRADRPEPAIEPDEMGKLVAAIEALNVRVASTWNGAGLTSGSVGLVRPAGPSLAAAVKRYHAGCLKHPLPGGHGNVFSHDGCAWYEDGRKLLVEPAWSDD